MGYRTVVMLSNDWVHEWSKDPELGAKISQGMHYTHESHPRHHLNPLGQYGRVVECVHADTQTLVALDGYQGFDALAYTSRVFGPSTDEDMLNLISDAADKLGYRLVKKSVKKA